MTRGYFGIGIYEGKNLLNIGGLWRSAQCFGASYIFTIGPRYSRRQSTDTLNATGHIPLFEFVDFDRFLESVPAHSDLIAVELLEDSRRLETFSHPPRATYILGPEDGTLPPAVVRCCAATIRIPGKHCLNVATAGAVVLYDRVVKRAKP